MYQSLTARISIVLPQEYAMQYHKCVFLIWIGGYTEMAKKYQQIGIGHTNRDISPSEHRQSFNHPTIV
jgi:hypothetical protein